MAGWHPDFDDVRVERLVEKPSVKWSLHSDDVVAAWVADMDFPIAPPIREALQHVIDHDDLGYPGYDLRDAVRQAFVDRMASEYDWRVELDDTWLLTTVVQGLHVALTITTAPGDGVIVQPPIYTPFLDAIDALDRRLVNAPLGRDGDRYVVDIDRLEAAVDAGSRALMLCNPHNPTGRVFTDPELRDIAEVVRRHDLFVVADEIHQDLRFPGHDHTVFARIAPDIAERTITVTSASKAFNLAGNRCSVIHFGSRELRRAFEAFSHRLFGEVSLLGHVSTLAAWTDPASAAWQRDLLEYLDGNRTWLAAALADHLPDARHDPPDGTYLAWVDLAAYELGADPAATLLERGRVALGSGPEFGMGGAGFVRVNLATSRRVLEQVLDRAAGAIYD